MRTNVGPLGLFCTALLVSALTLSIRSTAGYSQYDTASQIPSNTVPIVTKYANEPVHPSAAAVDADEASRLVVRVKKGDTLSDILMRSGVAADDAEQAISSLREVYNPRNLHTGQEVILLFAPDPSLAPASASGPQPPLGFDDFGTLLGVKIQPEAGREIAAKRDSSGAFSAADVQKQMKPVQVRSAGVIRTSLFDAAKAAGVPEKVLAEMIRAFSYDVDWQRDIQSGDRFDVLYEKLADDEGRSRDIGKVAFAQLVLSGQRLALYHYTTKDGATDYFNQKGESVRKALLRTPIDGARLSSTFGQRKHPILGFNRMHKGVDFAASKGTPVFAAGNGVVLSAGRYSNYGNYVEIRHDPEFHTAYGHLSRFAAGVHAGTRVSQGQVIGYVGATGMATGPHLHYEVIRNNSKVNPLSVNLPTGRKLQGKEFSEFLVAKSKVDSMVAGLPVEPKVASSE